MLDNLTDEFKRVSDCFSGDPVTGKFDRVARYGDAPGVEPTLGVTLKSNLEFKQ